MEGKKGTIGWRYGWRMNEMTGGREELSEESKMG